MTLRSDLVKAVLNRENVPVEMPADKISDFYASSVFTIETMRKYLPSDAFKSLQDSVENGTKIDRKIATQVAQAMKDWAISKGATHFTHWFQPLTGATAEKHDAFFSPIDNGRGIESFSSDALVQQEPDASSFPNGGLRATFEARGYTAWDPHSPAFIMSIGVGKTLCIPTIFIAYTGEALDYKAPLLKSQHLLETAALEVCQYFDKNITRVYPTLGWEQEYFVIDAAMYYARPDLVACERTLIGSYPAKHQQLSDHYFGAIPERVYAFMVDFETEAFKLGIPLKTRHNEVAPGQFECAIVYNEANLAVDQNQLTMDVMNRIARKHKLAVLLHEKPFSGINGSGKHNNWSLATNTGKNLLSPGKTPKNNLMFLTFFVNTIKAVAEYGDLLRAAIASAANDFRLGAHEAPPAIISIFIGTTLTALLDDLEQKTKKGKIDDSQKDELKLNIHNKIPDVLLDNTDRNRTSPFAFTGNKFEVRAVGSSANCASTMTVLNAIVGQQLTDFKKEVEALISKGEKKDNAILQILRNYITQSRKVLFEGDNYSEEWKQEAAKRGLKNVKDTPDALDFFITADAKKIFVGNTIYSEKELEARYEVLQDIYQMKVDIEARTLADMIVSFVVPATIAYQNELITNISGLKNLGFDKQSYQMQIDMVKTISDELNALKKALDLLNNEQSIAMNIENTREKAGYYAQKIKPYFKIIRQHADKLESLVADHLWQLPKYKELLFIK